MIKRRNLILSLTIFFSYIVLLESCLIDIPTPGNNPINDPKIISPPVFNSVLNDSIDSFLNYPRIVFRSTDNSVETHEIINSKYHLAFTDLIKYNNIWYIAFRFSDGHVATDFGHIIIAKSTDLQKWESEQIFAQNGCDLRDPKFFVKDSVLCIHFHSTTIKPYGELRYDYIAKYDLENDSWNKATKINKNTDEKSWFWRLTEHNDTVYTMAYRRGEPLKLYTSDDGTNFNEVYRFENISGYPSETTLRFKNDTTYAIVRRDGESTLLGISSIPDLTRWEFIELPMISFGGPNFLIYNEILIITGRINGVSKIFTYSLKNKVLKEISTLPGGVVEMGYCGMFIEKDALFLSYYTGTNTGTFSIKFSIINLTKILK